MDSRDFNVRVKFLQYYVVTKMLIIPSCGCCIVYFRSKLPREVAKKEINLKSDTVSQSVTIVGKLYRPK